MKATVTIEWSNEPGALVFFFPEVLTKTAAQEAIDRWNTEFTPMTGKAAIIWDCSAMKDYEPMARILWQKAMNEHKEKIKTIWLISESAMIRTAAKLLAMFVKLDIKPVKSREDIPVIA